MSHLNNAMLNWLVFTQPIFVLLCWEDGRGVTQFSSRCEISSGISDKLQACNLPTSNRIVMSKKALILFGVTTRWLSQFYISNFKPFNVLTYRANVQWKYMCLQFFVHIWNVNKSFKEWKWQIA